MKKYSIELIYERLSQINNKNTYPYTLINYHKLKGHIYLCGLSREEGSICFNFV